MIEVLSNDLINALKKKKVAKSITWFQNSRKGFSVTEDKTKGRNTSSSKGSGEKHLKRENSAFGDWRVPDSLTGIFIQVLTVKISGIYLVKALYN